MEDAYDPEQAARDVLYHYSFAFTVAALKRAYQAGGGTLRLTETEVNEMAQSYESQREDADG